MPAAANKAVRRAAVAKKAPSATPDPARPISPAAENFLDLFYAVHYKIGIGIEDSLRGGWLTRHQVAILWLIRSEGAGGRSIPRKDIERLITRWFELGNSAISKTLRVMARAPMELIEIREHPRSGREKEVFLTRKGVAEIERMVGKGRTFIQAMVDHRSAVEASQGVHFLTRVSHIIDIVEPTLRASRSAATRTRSTR